VHRSVAGHWPRHRNKFAGSGEAESRSSINSTGSDPAYLRLALLASSFIAIVFTSNGCASPSTVGPKKNAPGGYALALAVLRDSIQFKENAAVRAAAVEAMEADSSEATRPWIRSALLDDHPGVRFAACMAVGTLRDTAAEQVVRQRLHDADPSVRVGAIFALHRLGDDLHTGKLPTYLFDEKEVSARRNAALVIGRMNNPSGIRVLARAMKDRDTGVRLQALEGMARLGNSEARQELAFMANAGVGSDEVLALNALADLRDPVCADTFRFKLTTGTHIEVKLAAARGLALLGSDEGWSEAVAGLQGGPARRADDPRDPPNEQQLRIRQLAAAALGAMSRRSPMPELEKALRMERDPRVTVAIAKAMIEQERRFQAGRLDPPMAPHRR